MKGAVADKSITLLIDSKLENVFLVGIAIKAICEFILFDKNDANNVELGITEAVNNVIKHAYNSEPDHKIEVTISVFSNKMVFQISDIGKGMNLNQCNSNHACFDFEPNKIETLPVGGMGLHIINSVMDKASYKTVDGKNVLTLVKLLRKLR
jgi:serine/threonine-protein kinase RsbW